MKRSTTPGLFRGLKWTPIDVPEFKSEEEEADWWDTHKQEADDFVERADRAGAVTSGTVAAAMQTRQTTLRLRVGEIRRAKTLAERKGLPYQTYLKMLIHEGLERDERTG